ncbi:SDR family NAD(P)-dependent oxidoreductase [Bacillus sp. 31A1R]|uniref:SDR family NAD(P)-dependent oxidoreductase n=1 Tax=Robertmurraya mangrovi TaxID=3098077 RepID=A0ABU5J5C3_9BACI|nr:SDR family NAD(P)-dependent oxidoreductase [Bacillus sp. 31A1R]MDZ5474563.1 SDR family NAD(P)-dependent oxidoreductase [Bacillus sp. 31A1R]
MKSIIITGAGSGLGRELALLYGQKGFQIILVGRTQEKLDLVKREIEAVNGQAVTLSLDITDLNDINEKLSSLFTSNHLYGIINNAGVGYFGAFEELPPKEIEEMLRTNVLGTIFMTQAVIKTLRNQNDGFVMNIISTAGLKGKVNESVYVASKFAVRGFSESLQKEFADTNIRIQAVYMGGMDTPFWDDSEHIKDKSRLKSAKHVAEQIFTRRDEDTIIIES